MGPLTPLKIFTLKMGTPCIDDNQNGGCIFETIHILSLRYYKALPHFHFLCMPLTI